MTQLADVGVVCVQIVRRLQQPFKNLGPNVQESAKAKIYEILPNTSFLPV